MRDGIKYLSCYNVTMSSGQIFAGQSKVIGYFRSRSSTEISER